MVYEGYPHDYLEKKVIITAAITGGIHDKSSNPNLPEQPDEIVEDVRRSVESGASIVHIHARDEDGNPTKDPETFQEIRDGIAEACDDVIVNFTGGGLRFSYDECFRPIAETEPQPEIATIDLGPLNLGESTTITHQRDEHEEYARRMLDHGIKPELELFHPGQLSELHNLIDKDLVEPPYYCNLIFGMQTGTVPHPRNFTNFVDNLPEDVNWNCMAIGRHQLPLTTMGLIMGGHIRVGMEDNLYYRRGQQVTSNAELVERAARIAGELNRPVATPDEARDIIGL